MNNRHCFFFSIVIIAIIIKLSLFAFAAVHAPQGKLLPDSHGYLKLSDMLASKGLFAVQNELEYIGRKYRTILTPGFGFNFDLDKRLYREIQKKGFYWKYSK